MEEAAGFVTDRGQAVVIKSHEYASEEQVAYISHYVQELEDAIYGEDGYNGEGWHYSEYMDVDSLVYRYLIEEWSHNNDGGLSSFYLYKDSDSSGNGKLYAGPVWDYDTAFGASGRYRVYVETADKMLIKKRMGWINALFDDKTFVDKLNEVYSTAFEPTAVDLLTGGIDQWVTEISDSVAMDQARWAYADQGEVDFLNSVSILKSYIETRTDYLEGNFFTNDTHFKDVNEAAWCYKSVMYVADNGHMLGVGDQVFSPDQVLTRGMVVTILARVSWAVDKHIVAGYNDRTFHPNQSITREEMAQIIKNYAAYEGLDKIIDKTALAGFSEGNQVSSWTKDALCWCKSHGLIQGISTTELGSAATSTRAQFCAILKRYLS